MSILFKEGETKEKIKKKKLTQIFTANVQISQIWIIEGVPAEHDPPMTSFHHDTTTGSHKDILKKFLFDILTSSRDGPITAVN